MKPALTKTEVIDPKKLKAKDLISYTSFAIVKTIKPMRGGSKDLVVIDVDRSMEYEINGEELIESCQSADIFAKEKKVTKTEIAEMLVGAFNTPLTVVFKKADGTERTLRGRFVKWERLFGKSLLEDLDLPKGDNMRYVIHDNIVSLTINNVRYTRKK